MESSVGELRRASVAVRLRASGNEEDHIVRALVVTWNGTGWLRD
jgi:hypothetical protein